MKWSYGVTTVTERMEDGTLDRTLKSLIAAGFDRPHLFVDGPCRTDIRCLTTSRSPRIHAQANWLLSAWELYMREPDADRFAIFQDDFITYRNLRQYLEQCEYPVNGYWNLYTFPENHKPQGGWYLSNQLGKGAVGLVFNKEALLTLLTSEHFSRRVEEKELRGHRIPRGHRAVDGGVVTALKKAGYKEYVHTPSLVQHTGETSVIGNRVHEKAQVFEGEDFDALKLLDQDTSPAVVKVKKHTPRIGLVGYNAPTGLGEVNRQLADNLNIDKWLVKPHSRHGVGKLHEMVDNYVCPTGSEQKLKAFLSGLDVVLFAETPYYRNLIPLCKKLKKRIVCIPMLEWTPPVRRGWTEGVDLFICPTETAYEEMKNEVPCRHVPWPIDIDRFKFRQRDNVKRYLYIHGSGGWKGRKGGDVVQKAKRMWPEMPLTVIAQSGFSCPGAHIVASPRDNADLYKHGDVLLVPHRMDGLGLQPLEAMACGMPVIMTNGKPWNEYNALARISSTKSRVQVKRMMDWYEPNASNLVDLCKHNLGKDITRHSQSVREWAELRRWSVFAPEIEELVRTGLHRMRIPFELEQRDGKEDSDHRGNG